MSNEDAAKVKSSFVIKIMIPVLIICVIAVIWILKNTKDTKLPLKNDNSDFALDITEKIDIDKLKSYGLPIIIDFGSDTCIPCLEMAPVLEELNEALQGKVIIRFVNVGKYPEFAGGYPVEVIPTQIFIDSNGEPYVPADPETLGMLMYATRDTNEHVFTAHQGGLTKEQFMSVLKEMGLEE